MTVVHSLKTSKGLTPTTFARINILGSSLVLVLIVHLLISRNYTNPLTLI